MEKIAHENELKNNIKRNSNETVKLISENNSTTINMQNNNLNNINNDKNISYSFEHSKYKTSKLFGINIYHVGNLYVFGFLNKNSEPLFCIDNGWYFQLIIYIVELLIFYFGNKYFFSKLETWKYMCFNILLFLFFLIYTALITINPGIVIKNEKREGNEGIFFCRRCKIYTVMMRNTQHCYDCDVCVRKLDHHCTVVRRCITNRNFWLFVGMIAAFILIYVFSLVNIIIYAVGSFRKFKKNK